MTRTLKVAPKPEARLPIVLATWSMKTRSGLRADGISVHLNSSDHARFIAEHRERDSICDQTTHVIDANPSLHGYLLRKRSEGVFGVRARNEEEAVLRDGDNPYSDDKFYVEIAGMDGEHIYDPEADGVSLVEARRRVDLLATVHVKAAVLDDNEEVVYGLDDEEGDETEEPRRRRRAQTA